MKGVIQNKVVVQYYSAATGTSATKWKQANHVSVYVWANLTGHYKLDDAEPIRLQQKPDINRIDNGIYQSNCSIPMLILNFTAECCNMIA